MRLPRRKKIEEIWACHYCKKRYGEFPIIVEGGYIMELCEVCYKRGVAHPPPHKKWWQIWRK